jgi:flagella basal body P-ring formation protein FlgA
VAQKPAPPSRLKGTLKITLPKSDPRLATSPIIITVKGSAEVNTEFFRLGDIAELAGRDEDYKRQLAEVEVGRAPLPGYTRTLTTGDIVVKLRAARLESDRIELICPPQIRISRAKADIALDRLQQTALTAVQEAYGANSEVAFEVVPFKGTAVLPAGKVRYVAGNPRGTLQAGQVFLPVSIFVDDKPQQTIEMTVKVKRKVRVVVALRNIEAREILTDQDVGVTLTELSSDTLQPVSNLLGAVGKRLTRKMTAGQVLSQVWIENPPVIVARDTVQLDQAIGAIHISTVVIARQSGGVGDTIRVYCEVTRKEIEVVVVDAKTVRLPGTD